MKKYREAKTCDMLGEILERQVQLLLTKESWGHPDFIAIEKLTKVYSLLKDDLRDDIKTGLHDKLNANVDAEE